MDLYIPAAETRFHPGLHLSITPGARDALGDAGIPVASLLNRHLAGDWGDMDAEDRACNDEAVRTGDRVFSSYRVLPERLAQPMTAAGLERAVWVITDGWIDERGTRYATTVLLPREY